LSTSTTRTIIPERIHSFEGADTKSLLERIDAAPREEPVFYLWSGVTPFAVHEDDNINTSIRPIQKHLE
jgi:hypothetical protein